HPPSAALRPRRLRTASARSLERGGGRKERRSRGGVGRTERRASLRRVRRKELVGTDTGGRGRVFRKEERYVLHTVVAASPAARALAIPPSC
ncbi:MAG: hypothetical protein BJ554DRAFT_3232, partial [Olpidium bornovanus]